MIDFIKNIDYLIFMFFNQTLKNDVFDVFFPYITSGKNWVIPSIIMIAIFLYKKRVEALVVIVLLGACAGIADPVSSQVFKKTIQRNRPSHPSYFDKEDNHTFLKGGYFSAKKTSYSFPSSHASNAFALGTLLILVYPRRKAYYITIAVLIGLSRVYIGVHYPFDIIGGALLGFGVGHFVFFMYHRFIQSKFDKYLPSFKERIA